MQNRVTKFISSISMEIYLSHMVIYRLIEKLHLNAMLGKGWLSYIVLTIGTIVVTIVFSLLCKKMINIIEKKAIKKLKRIEN